MLRVIAAWAAAVGAVWVSNVVLCAWLQTGLVTPRVGVPASAAPTPCLIHQTWRNETVPERWAGSPAAWRQHHPACVYRLWSDADLRSLVRDHYGWFLDTYDAYPYGIQRVDAARYFILHRWGGVYVDLDIAPVGNVMALFARGVTLVITPNVGLSNALMAAPPGDPFFAHVVHRLAPNNVTRIGRLGRHMHIVSTTGPLFLWNAYSAYHAPQTVTLLASRIWGKCSLCQPAAASTLPYFQHALGDSW